MKGRIFVVTLVAASLMSFGAYAKPHGHSGPTSSNVSIISQKGKDNTAVVVQAQNITVVIGGFGY
jgi:hypothetical protein